MSIMADNRVWISFSLDRKSERFWNLQLKPSMSHWLFQDNILHVISQVGRLTQDRELGVIFDGEIPDTIRKSQEFVTLLKNAGSTPFIALNWSNPDVFLSIIHRPCLIFGYGAFASKDGQLSKLSLLSVTCKSRAKIQCMCAKLRYEPNLILICKDQHFSVLSYHLTGPRSFNSYVPDVARQCCVECGEKQRLATGDPMEETICDRCHIESI